MRFKGLGRVLVVLTICLVCVAAGFGVGRVFNSHQQSARAGQEALKVHGIWDLAVYKPDGELVASSHFHNDLITVNQAANGGDVTLADLLTGTYAMGPWQLYAADPNGAALFQLSSAADIGLQGVNGPLSVSAATPGHVILSGMWTAGSNVTVGRVSTSVSLCGNTTAPASCVNYFGDFFYGFTRTTLALANQVSVANGQILQIKVDISFS
jgi:hypothetical protein